MASYGRDAHTGTIMRWYGVIHLPPLPGSPACNLSSPEPIYHYALEEARKFHEAGASGVILENYGDRPYYTTKVEPVVPAMMAVMATMIRDAGVKSVGINILRNASVDALAAAYAGGADFIRVNVLTGVMATDQGWIEGTAAQVLRFRRIWNAEHIRVLADLRVKHALSPVSWDLEDELDAILHRAMADGLILTGPRTGIPPSRQWVQTVREKVNRSVELWVGSGVTPENVLTFADLVDGIIISSALREGGQPGSPLDPARVRKWSQTLKALQS